jgi:hypothetical protein
MKMTTQEFVYSLTTEQVSRLHDIAFGKIPDAILELSDDELLEELFA